MLKKLFQKIVPGQPPTLDAELATARRRALDMLASKGLDPKDPVAALDAFIEARQKGAPGNPPADLLSDLAALIGEHARGIVGGEWGEDPLFGLSILQPGGVPHGVFGPLQAVRKKWQLGEGLKLEKFFANLPQHLKAAANRPAEAPLVLPKSDTNEKEFAASAAQRACAVIARDLGVEVPMTLVGLRTAERWLRGQFLVRTASPGSIHCLGFLVGEVMRGLYGGDWSFDQARHTGNETDVALIYPEIPFYPLGRVMKLMVEQPEGNGLDEYVRLVPAARKDMRSQS